MRAVLEQPRKGSDPMREEAAASWHRHDEVMRRCRAIERHAAALRGELLRLAAGEGACRRRADRALRALHEELRRAATLAEQYTRAGDGRRVA
jgi:hypothetical protein